METPNSPTPPPQFSQFGWLFPIYDQIECSKPPTSEVNTPIKPLIINPNQQGLGPFLGIGFTSAQISVGNYIPNSWVMWKNGTSIPTPVT